MHIGIDVSRYRHDTPTGVEVYSKEIVEELVNRFGKNPQHQLVLYTPQLIPSLPASLQVVIPGKRLWTQWHLARFLQKNPPEVLFVPSHVLPWRPRLKSVLTIHDVAFHHFPQAYSPFQRFYLEWSTRFAIQNASKIIVPSEATCEDLIRFYRCPAEKLVVIPHGFRPERISVSADEQRSILKRFHLQKDVPYFFYVGRLEQKKNIERLLLAFKQFKKNHPQWRLILGGSRGHGFRSILKTIHRENLLQDVLMPGYLTPEEKQVLLEHAHGFVFPSLYEGFGFPILEASQHGLPVLASQITAFKPFEKLVEVWVDPQNVDSIAAGLEKLSSQEKSSQKSQGLVHYSWSHNAEHVWNILIHS